MHLTQYTDYSLRVLLYLALNRDRRCTIGEIAEAYGVSRNHLVKVVHNLSKDGWITTVRGKAGGMALALPPEQIRLGAVVRQTEPHMNLLECFDSQANTCPITDACALKRVLYQARRAFLKTLDDHTLADVMGRREQVIEILSAQ
ncbi:MAG: Rrf2 family transcriptional regulator [Mariprofundaceae bacterium]